VGLKIVTAHWLDQIHLWIFFAMVPSTFLLTAIIYPLRRSWLIESRKWPVDKDIGIFDESSHNKTGESFNRWLIRNQHYRLRAVLKMFWITAVFIMIWPLISKDYCSINKCRGVGAPVAVSSP
jgi:hypothetical protein